jgi:hypothetical protein
MELELPVGDAGMDNGTVGGFYADSRYGYVLESRKEPLIIREAGTMERRIFCTPITAPCIKRRRRPAGCRRTKGAQGLEMG